MTKVLMYPELRAFQTEESGIKRVVEAYHKYLPDFGVELVGTTADSYDIVASHAGIHPGADVVHTHGLYWTADYYHSKWELRANSDVINSVRHAKEVTVPSKWVQETFQRDMRFSPHVIPHGIDYEQWEHDNEPQGYVLWNKNRIYDVCDPKNVGTLASAFPRIPFISTFPPDRATPLQQNIKVVGLIRHSAMKKLVQSASVYLSTTKETFGIGVLEAMAAGVPVLGFAHGGNIDLVEHGVTGYLARPGSEEDLIVGLEYCMKHREALGANAREIVKKWTWKNACELVASVYDMATKEEAPTVGIVIPSFEYGTEDKLGRAIRSAIAQTFHGLTDIVVVDDGSDDDGATEELVKKYSSQDDRVKYVWQHNSGVATARNRGIRELDTKYVICLDADDAIAPSYAAVCVPELEGDESLGIAYTGLHYIRANGDEGLSPWPGEYNFDAQIRRKNQVPTCCMFRREMWARLGGYKSRYAPEGAGSEDAEFWTRAGAYGWGAKKVTNEGLFIYSWQTGRVSGNENYSEVDWLELHPWAHDGFHPFASVASPENKISHLVRQYDEPLISVIIPVGMNHNKIVTDALDTLEGQSFRKWEVILVWDNDKSSEDIRRVYPYARIIEHYHQHGAGAARNVGADVARAPLLLFLDADDQLFPNALDELFGAFKTRESIVYSDYVGKAQISPEDIDRLQDAERLIAYNNDTQIAVMHHKSYDYDCDLAQAQPYDPQIYIWCLVSSLVPRKWHYEIGGFDEQMQSWEDWDYWLRMAYMGKCFTRVEKELVVYRFYSGTRREIGREENQILLQYLRDKFKGVEKMPCCGGKTTNVRRRPIPTPNAIQKENEMNLSEDSEMILVRFDDGNRGQHKVIGHATRRFYGQRASGETFYVHKSDIAAQPHVYHPIQETKVVETAPQAPPPPPPEVTKTIEEPVERAVSAASLPIVNQLTNEEDEEVAETIGTVRLEVNEEDVTLDLQKLPGVTNIIAGQLNAMGIHTREDLRALGIDGLMKIKGIGAQRADAIMNYLNQP